MRSVLVDAGALIARIDADDVHHERCVAALKEVRAPLASVLPAITEAMHFLSDVPGGQGILCDMLADGAIQVLTLEAPDFTRIKQLMRKDRDRPMDFADAALVVVAERDGLSTILTFDDDFSIYRLPGRARFVVLPSAQRE